MVSANFSHLCPSINGCENQICSEQREMIFLNLRLDSKEFAAFLRVSKHFEKMIRSQVFDIKRVCKVGKPCLFTSCVGDPHFFKARAISHFLVTRSRAVRKLYEATLKNALVLLVPKSCRLIEQLRDRSPSLSLSRSRNVAP